MTIHTTGFPNDNMSTLSLSNRRNVVIREVCDRDGLKLGTVVRPHDGSIEGIVTAAQAATERMFAIYSDASNVQSRICATDDTGKARWSISPNFAHIAEIGPDEARFILGDLSARR